MTQPIRSLLRGARSMADYLGYSVRQMERHIAEHKAEILEGLPPERRRLNLPIEKVGGMWCAQPDLLAQWHNNRLYRDPETQTPPLDQSDGARSCMRKQEGANSYAFG